MGRYPNSYPQSAISMAAAYLHYHVEPSLLRDGEWGWKLGRGHILSPDQVRDIGMQLPRCTDWDFELRLLTDVFRQTLPLVYYKLASHGYQLAFDDQSPPALVLEELSPVRVSDYIVDEQAAAFVAAKDAVRALVQWRLMRHRAKHPGSNWPTFSVLQRHTFITTFVYEAVERLAATKDARVQDVVRMLEESVPDLREQWLSDGYRLEVAQFMAQGAARCVTNLRLVPKV